MSDTVKGALIIGICLMLGLWGAGWLSKSDVGRYQRSQQQSHSGGSGQNVEDASVESYESMTDTGPGIPRGIPTTVRPGAGGTSGPASKPENDIRKQERLDAQKALDALKTNGLIKPLLFSVAASNPNHLGYREEGDGR